MSIKRLLIAATVAIAALLVASAVFSLYVLAAAEAQLSRALRSHEQLAIATGLEADAARAMLHALQVRSGSPQAQLPAVARDAVEARIATLIDAIRAEIGTIVDPDEQAEEAEEFVAAFAVRAAYARLFRNLDSGDDGAALDAGVVAEYLALDRRLAAVADDERAEVARAIADLGARRDRLRLYALVATLLAVGAIGLAAGLSYRLLMRPLRLLEAGSAELAEGNIAHRIAAEGPPEFARLAERLNVMAERLEVQRSALRDSNERLEQTVAERTAELADQAERLQRVDDSRRLFFAKVGHELRTPLTVLLGETEVAMQGRFDTVDPYREALEHIAANGEQLKRRIADLMMLARSDDGRLAVTRESVDLPALARATVEATGGYAAVRDVRLTLDIGTPLPTLFADADRLRQALLALIDNAIRFSPAGREVTLQLDCDDREVVIRVLDEGPGVAEDELALLAQPWFQGGGTVGQGGTGLGMAVARWVAEQHGGQLRATHRDGGGLAVALHLPRPPDCVGVGAA